MKSKTWPAVAGFVVLMLIAAWRLEGKVLAMVLVLLAAMLAKTLIAVQQRKEREAEAAELPTPSRT